MYSTLSVSPSKEMGDRTGQGKNLVRPPISLLELMLSGKFMGLVLHCDIHCVLWSKLRSCFDSIFDTHRC